MNFFDTLIDLPLFKGVTRETMAEITGKYRLGFRKFAQGETLVHAGDECRVLTFVLSGLARVTTELPMLHLSYTLPSGSVVMAENLFGRLTRYPSTVMALEPVGTMEITKRDYFEILHHDPIFMYNYLNLLSWHAQKAYLNFPDMSLLSKLRFYVENFTEPGATDIVLEARQSLCDKLGVSALVYEAELTALRNRRIVSEFDIFRIVIPSRDGFRI